MYSVSARAGLTAAAAAAALLVAAGCSSSQLQQQLSSGHLGAASAQPRLARRHARAAGAISVHDLNNSFSAMAQLKPIAAAGKGASR